jgi:hypothetical protein
MRGGLWEGMFVNERFSLPASSALGIDKKQNLLGRENNLDFLTDK